MGMGPLVSDGATPAENAAGLAVCNAQREIRRAKRALKKGTGRREVAVARLAEARAAEKVARAFLWELIS